MSKKKKVLGALVCAGLALGVFGGGAVIASAYSGSSADSAAVKARQDGHGGHSSFKNPCNQQLSDEQVAALEAYAELSKEAYEKYSTQYAALVSAYEAEVAEIYASVLGEPYQELVEEYDGLCGQYQGLVNGFYASEEYTALKTELDELITSLAASERGSEEHLAIMEQIHEVWGKISVLAGETNSQIVVLRTRAAEITAEIKTLINQNKEALKAELDPVIAEFNTAAQEIQTGLSAELQLLRETLGI